MTYIFRVRLKPEGPQLFEPGSLLATPGAIELMRLTETSALRLIVKHVAGNWGECDPDDVRTNNEAVVNGARVLSVYRLPLMDATNPRSGDGTAVAGVEDDRIFVVTEADRSVTTLMLPEEY